MSSIKQGLVSIVIPCYNQAEWVAEAIESALNQTHPNKEVIVVDDGSTDNSRNVIKQFGEKITFIASEHCNGNTARNKGFAVSYGEYIQFLDADDYILPEKIAAQVECLEQTGSDIVYGDWRHVYMASDGSSMLGEVKRNKPMDNVLQELLGGWWTAGMSLLVRRRCITSAGGWDENIQAGQDKDFFISLLLHGASAVYQSGCGSVYRRHEGVSVSTTRRERWLQEHLRVLEKAESLLREKIPDDFNFYAPSLAKGYFHIARNYYDRNIEKMRAIMEKVKSLDDHFVPQESNLYRFFYRLLGMEQAEKFAGLKRRLLRG